MKFNVYFIRHGISVANEERIIAGWCDTPLSNSGIKQLEALKKEIIYPQADLYFSSPLIRAIDTMKILYEAVDYSLLKGFKELNFGVYEGLPYAKEAECRKLLLCGKKVENGESLFEFRHRVIEELTNVCRILYNSKNTQAIVVCHSLVIKSLLGYFDNYQTYEFNELFIENGRGVHFCIDYCNDSIELINKEFF